MNIFAAIRLVVFGVILLFSFINLALAANLTSKTEGWTFPGFAVAVSILTLIIAIPMLVVDFLRKGSFVSWVATELGWCGLLWVLWIASAGLSTSTLLFIGDCSVWSPSLETLCRQYSAVQAFSWLTWLLLTFYIITVIVLSVLATVKGNSRVWLSPASDLSFSPTHTASGEPKIPPYNPNYAGTPAGGAYAGNPAGGYAGTPGAYPPGQQQQGYNAGPGQPISPNMTGASYNQYNAPGQHGGYGQPGHPNVAQV